MTKIVYSCNDGYFDGLYLSILSIVRRCKKPIAFYLLSADCTEINSKYTMFSKKHENIISKLIKKYNSKNSFCVIDCKKEWKHFIKGGKNDNTHYSPYACFRLLLDKLNLSDDKILYLDVDTLACKDVSDLFNINIEKYDFACVIDRLGHIWHGKNCFNSGIMLFNIKNIKKHDLFSRALWYVKNRKLHFVDQAALRLAKPSFLYIDKKYNEQKDIIIGETAIKHFCARFKGWPKYHNIKQWDLKNIHRIKNIDFFKEDYRIFAEEKKKW